MRLVVVHMLLALLGCNDSGPGSSDRAHHGDDDDADVDEVSATVEEHGVRVCPAPEDRDRLGPWHPRGRVPQTSTAWTWGTLEERNHISAGLMLGDLDGDGHLDVVAPTVDGLELYVGAPGGLLAIDGLRTLGTFAASFGSGGSLADYDGDGDLDIYVTRVLAQPEIPEADGKNFLLRNDGGGIYTDVTDVAGVSGCGVHHRTGVDGCYRSMASSWADYDRDGDLDLYVGNYGWVDDEPGVGQAQFEPAEPDFLYRNEGDGTFSDVSAVLPPEVHDGYTFAGGFHDFDADHRPDLYVVNDFGALYPNRVLWNRGGELVYDPVDTTNLVHSMTGMGLATGDLNGDGWLDLAVPQWKHNQVLESDPATGLWFDTTNLRALVPDLERGQHVAWGSEFGDLDNDGDLDSIIQYGHLFSEKSLWDNAITQPDGVYMNETVDGDWQFVDRGAEYGVVDAGSERGGLLVDLDRDGYLDLLKRALVGPDPYYLSRCGSDGWLEVHLRQPETLNRFAVGARVEIEAGAQRFTRHINAGGTSFASAGPPEAHFGLGNVDQVDRIRVLWPDGEATVFEAIDTRQQITITRTP